MKQYDYIITGAGCAGLSLLLRLLHEPAFAGKKILLADREPRRANDRTWCFWEKEPGFFEHLVYRKWDRLQFHGSTFSRKLDIAPYQYKMIRGIDFYTYCFSEIRRYPNVSIVFGNVDAVTSAAEGALVTLNGETISASYVFNSILFEKPQPAIKQHYLLQHFKGRVIDSAEPVFDDSTATLMDFRVAQDAGATFVYVMPFTARRALVEYTLFSPAVLEQDVYDKGLDDYIRRVLRVDVYAVIEEETGCIPMTNYPFPPYRGNIINIGTAGGQTRASSGYTFWFIQKRVQAIVNSLLLTDHPFTGDGLSSKKSKFYDSVLLHILAGGKLSGEDIFSRLFRKNRAQAIFRFLDDESSVKNDLSIIGSLPALPFLGAALAEGKPW